MPRLTPRSLLILGCALAAPHPITAQTVANYSTNFTPGQTPGTSTAGFASLANGWGYFWNAPAGWSPAGASGSGTSNPFGTPANYRPLVWAGGNLGWTADGDTTSGNNQPSGFLRLSTTTGHPGLGSAQAGGVGNARDRYIVAAYEIQPGDPVGNPYRIEQSSIAGTNNSGTPHRVTIHVNDNPPVFDTSFPKDGTLRAFDTDLGTLAVGDRIYVGLGPDGNAGSDAIVSLNFTIATGEPPGPPEPPIPPPPPPIGSPPVEIALTNPSAETNNGIDRTVIPDPSVPGWDSDNGAQVIHWGTSAGNGDWRFTFEDSATLFQKTGHTIAAGEAFSLRFDASAFSNLPPSVTAELFVVDPATPATRTTVASGTFTFAPAAVDNWQTFQLDTYYGDLDDHVGKTIGVHFSGPDSALSRFLAIDDIRLTAYDGVLPPLSFAVTWENLPTRTWTGAGLWSNRLQDWRVSGALLRSINAASGRPFRTTHLLTHRLTNTPANFSLTVRTGRTTSGSAPANAFTGFLVGAGQNLDVRGAAMVHHNHGKDGGLYAGIDGRGRATIRDNTVAGQPSTGFLLDADGTFPPEIELTLTATYIGPDYAVEITARNPATDSVISRAAAYDIPPHRLVGNIALAANPGNGGTPASFYFKDWTGTGSKLAPTGVTFGPVLAAQHTLSRNVLKLTAQLAPFATSEAATATLETDTGAGFTPVATSPIDPVAHTATFRVPGWQSTRDTPYRVALQLRAIDATLTDHYYQGTVRAEPLASDQVVLAGVNCMTHVIKSGGGPQGIDTTNPVQWSPDFVIFPHNDLTSRMAAHDPDLLFFAGDQIYEGSSPTRADNSSAVNRELDYLYKWFYHLWTFGDLLRDIPSVCIPDDHDVYQGNLWGQGGRAIGAQEQGGYVRPVRFVQMVERTQTSHLPDPFDPAPAGNLNVYYGSLRYGQVDFAILEDRKFKNGFHGQPQMPSPIPGSGTPMRDPSVVDPPGLQLLGERQETFLDHWVTDWDGTVMKAALSQTMFSSTTTHTGEGLGRRYHDYDSGGWPRSGRQRAVNLLRQAFAPHICGDQHLSLVVKHGTDTFSDAVFAYCMPAGANFFPRAFDPQNRVNGPTATVRNVLTDYTDGFGNLLTTLAVANPAAFYTNVSTNRAPLDLHDRAAGYAIVRFDKPDRTTTFENWPRHDGGQYAGWPVTVRQRDNDGRTPTGYLPIVSTTSGSHPAVTVTDESTGERLYALRASAPSFRPHVFSPGPFLVEFTDPITGLVRSLTPQSPSQIIHTAPTLTASHPTAIEHIPFSLTWTTAPGANVTIVPGIGDVTALTVNGIGSLTATVSADTTFTLTSTHNNTPLTTSLTVTAHPDYATWRATTFTFAQLADPRISGDGADPDADDIPNILEFVLRSAPFTPSPLPTLSPSLEIAYSLPPLNHPGFTATIEHSTDLKTWLPTTTSPLPQNHFRLRLSASP